MAAPMDEAIQSDYTFLSILFIFLCRTSLRSKSAVLNREVRERAIPVHTSMTM